MSERSEKNWGDSFVTHLEKLLASGDRGALAGLRRGLGKPPGTAAEMHPHVAWAVQRCKSRWEEDCYYIIAPLFAFWHQGKNASVSSPHKDLGASMRQWAWDEEKHKVNEDRFKSIERRFVALLNCHRDDLHVHLRRVVGLLKSKEIPVDWPQLLFDIRGWDWDSRRVQRRWAKSFWAGQPRTDASQLAAAEGAEETTA